MVRHVLPYCSRNEPVVYGRSYLSHTSRTRSEISCSRLLGRSGYRWCSIWWHRLPLMNRSAGPPSKFALPSIWRRYHWPFVSPIMSVLVNFSAPSGKWPQKMTAFVHTLRITLASALAFNVDMYVAPGDRDVTAGHTT